jgi:branched-chain amino acid transport system permease protein
VTLSALLVQVLNGLASASSLFLVSAGLSLIFGVTRIVNFAHGSLMMLGAYTAYSLIGRLGGSPLGYWAAVALAAILIAVLGALLESTLLRRLYGRPELLQLLATFGIVLVVQDATLAAWGAEDLLGPRAPGFSGVVAIAGGAVPAYDLLLIAIGPAMLFCLWWLLSRTRFGMLVRAATENRVLTAALGINERLLFTSVFALGAGLAGLAGALQLPREPASLGMDLSIIADAFVVTVIGGLGSMPGAFVAALLIGLSKALCIALGTVDVGGMTIAFPKLTLVAEFLIMAGVLILRPHGLFGRAPDAVPPADTAGRAARTNAPERRTLIAAAVLVVCAAALPLVTQEYTLVVVTDILVFALFGASLQLLLGSGGMISFGHACYFGLGAYAAALATRHGAPFVVAFVAAPFTGFIAAVVFGWLCVRLSGVYMAMLTLSFAQIVWSIAQQWDSVTGGSNGLIGVWPTGWLAGRAPFFELTLSFAAAGLAILVWIRATPFGYALRGARDSPLRAQAIGIDVRRIQWAAFALAGAFAGLAGGLYAFSKGSIGPDTLAIPRSIDGLLIVLLGGIDALSGPLIGAAAFTWLHDILTRHTEYWRSAFGCIILLLVLAFPLGIAGAASRLVDRLGAPRQR